MPRSTQRSRCATVALSFVAIGWLHSAAMGELVRRDDSPSPLLVRTAAINRVIGEAPSDDPTTSRHTGVETCSCSSCAGGGAPAYSSGGPGYDGGGYEVSDDSYGGESFPGGCGGQCDMGCDDGCGPSCGPSCGSCYGSPYCETGGECCPEMCMERRPCPRRCAIFGEFLYLQVTDADVVHAQQQNGIGGAGTVPFGEIASIGQDYNPGFRVGGSIACGPSSGVGVSFTHFESDSASHLNAPIITGGGGAVGSLVHHAGASITASAGPVDATYDVDFQLADVMWHKTFMQSARYNLGFSCGAEFGHMDQDFRQSGIFGGGQSGAIDTTTSIGFDGAGIKLGLDGDHQFSHGLGIYGRLTAAALTGRFDSDYTMFNATTDTDLAIARWTDDRVVGQIEYEVGMSCTSCNNRWRIATGYMFSYWTNMVTTPEFIDAVQADNYTDVGGTIGFNGLVSRVECRW